MFTIHLVSSAKTNSSTDKAFIGSGASRCGIIEEILYILTSIQYLP
jgi:hypothetical protein